MDFSKLPHLASSTYLRVVCPCFAVNWFALPDSPEAFEVEVGQCHACKQMWWVSEGAQEEYLSDLEFDEKEKDPEMRCAQEPTIRKGRAK